MSDRQQDLIETVSLGATVRTQAMDVRTLDRIGYAISTTGTAEGSWAVQYSNTYRKGVDDPTSDDAWDTYTLDSSPPDATGSAQKFGIRLNFFEYLFVRIKFTRTAGTGTATIAYCGKGS